MGFKTNVPPKERDLRTAAGALDDPLAAFAAGRADDPVRDAPIAPMNPDRWPVNLQRVALSYGYDFPAGQIQHALRSLVERFGEPEVSRTWEVWCASAAEMGEDLAWINPRAFATRYGFWRQLAPVPGHAVPARGHPGVRLVPESNGNRKGSRE